MYESRDGIHNGVCTHPKSFFMHLELLIKVLERHKSVNLLPHWEREMTLGQSESCRYYLLGFRMIGQPLKFKF